MTRKDWQQIKVELKRKITHYKLRVIPTLKTLDFSFFMRLGVFCGVIYVLSTRLNTLESEKVVCQQEGPDSPSRFSKTFGLEKKLDSILQSEEFKNS